MAEKLDKSGTDHKRHKTSIADDVTDHELRQLATLISNSPDADFVYEFLCCLFTPAERKDFAARWILIKELDKGTTQREIAQKYNMSLCKITRGSRELRKDGSAFRKMLALLQESGDN